MSPRYLVTLTIVLVLTATTTAQEAVRLRESFATGNQYRVSTRVEMTGTLSVPMEMGKGSKPVAVTGDSAIDYDERVLELDKDGGVKRTLRIYRKHELQRKVGQRA